MRPAHRVLTLLAAVLAALGLATLALPVAPAREDPPDRSTGTPGHPADTRAVAGGLDTRATPASTTRRPAVQSWALGAATGRPAAPPRPSPASAPARGQRAANDAGASGFDHRSLAGAASSLLWPVLDAISAGSSEATRAITGDDPLAPRPLELWLREDGTMRLVARTASGEDGRFDFGAVPLPHRPIGWVVVPTGSDPRVPTARRFDRELPPPAVEVEARNDGKLIAHLRPALHAGELELRTATGAPLTRVPLTASEASPRGVIVRLPSAGDLDERIVVVHRLPDGRQSVPTVVLWPDAGR